MNNEMAKIYQKATESMQLFSTSLAELKAIMDRNNKISGKRKRGKPCVNQSI